MVQAIAQVIKKFNPASNSCGDIFAFSD